MNERDKNEELLRLYAERDNEFKRLGKLFYERDGDSEVFDNLVKINERIKGAENE